MVINTDKKIILLGGPTASGKSERALNWAAEFDGEIINADSMQIYKELNIITACPSDKDMIEIPHHMYRTLNGDDPCSAERWRDMARMTIDDIWARGKTPIVVGGTGLYFKTLVSGISKVPKIDNGIRREIRTAVLEKGSEDAHTRLQKLDPIMAKHLAPGDSQRVARALEVIISTGKSLDHWQAQPPTGGIVDEEIDISKHVLLRDRTELYERCDRRFKLMIEDGKVIEEVKALAALNYDKHLPIMKSLGVPQIMDYLQEILTLDEMIHLSQTATRQFAKRQMTWFRNQFADWKIEKL